MKRIIPFLLLYSLLFTYMFSGCVSDETSGSSEDVSLNSFTDSSNDASINASTSDGSSRDESSLDESTSAESSDTSEPETSSPDESLPDEKPSDNPSDKPSENPSDTPSNKLSTIERLGGYENLNLTYTFRYYNSDRGRHTESDFMPYVAYLDKNGNIKDYFFDSYLFLPCVGAGPSGASMHADLSNPTKAKDWIAYVDDTFAVNANVSALNSAFGKVKSQLGDSDKKAGVFFTLLYPSRTATNFGTLGGKSLNFSKTADRKYAIKWMIDEQIKKLEQTNCKNLELVGFYWLEEYLVEEGDAELLKYASEYLHSKGLKFIWIPWYRADGYTRHEDFGFDVTAMQPNLFWLGFTDPYRVTDSAELSKKYGMCMEMELDFNVSQEYYFNRYLYYLEGGMTSGMMDEVKMYYQDTGPGVYYSACYSNNSLYRSVYDLTYKYANGTLTQADIDKVRPKGVEDNVVSDVRFDKIMEKAKWVSIGKSYTGCRSYTDGNGMGYQDVSGKELTDGIIASEELSTDWFAFHKTIRDNSGRFSITVDLGKLTEGIKHFAAHFDNKQLYAIGTPLDIKIYTSRDGNRFDYYGTADLILDPNYSAFYLSGEEVSARYVKLSIGDSDKQFIFCSEFLVGVDK